jgi:hypothetical protein
MNKAKLFIVSFGQSFYYYRLANSIVNRITSVYDGSVGIAYNENSLTDEMIQYALNFPRGFGYWRWKPFVILKTMKSMKSNDVLLYVDGRANFKSNSIRFLNDFMNSEQFDIVVNRGGRESIEKNWTTKKVLIILMPLQLLEIVPILVLV